MQYFRERGAPGFHMSELGEDALAFAKWFRRSKFHLMAGFAGELEKAPHERDRADLTSRFERALRHGQRVLAARVVVTVLLALGVVATAAATIARMLYVPDPLTVDLELTLRLIDRLAAYSASATLLLVGLRLVFDRYLDMVSTSATFLAMQIATCAHEPRQAT